VEGKKGPTFWEDERKRLSVFGGEGGKKGEEGGVRADQKVGHRRKKGGRPFIYVASLGKRFGGIPGKVKPAESGERGKSL